MASEPKLDPQSLTKKRPQSEALHINVRVTGDDAQIFEHLRSRTANITDSLRVRDSIRTVVFLQAMKEKGSPVVCDDGHGNLVEVLEHLGVFFPESGAKPTQRQRRKLQAT